MTKLTEEDVVLVRDLVGMREILIITRKELMEEYRMEMDILNKEIKNISNTKIAEKFGVTKCTIQQCSTYNSHIGE